MRSIIFRATDVLSSIDILSPVPTITELPPEIITRIGGLITLFKAIGIVFVIYIIFIIVKSILDIIRGRRIYKIYNKIYEIDEKLDKILGNYKKEDKIKPSHKKEKNK